MDGEVLAFLHANDHHFRSSRLPSLYSDFRRQQFTNPDGYTANVEAWTSGILKAAKARVIPGCEDSTIVIQTGPSLLQALESKEWGQPTALQAFVEEAKRRGEIIPLGTFQQALSSTGAGRSSVSPWQLISWALAQVGLHQGGASKLIEGRYVLMANLRDSASRLAQVYQTRSGTLGGLIPMNEFTRLATRSLDLPTKISKEDLQALLLYLSRDRHDIVYNNNLVKILSKGELMPAITQHDNEIASIKSLIYELSEQSSDTEAELHKLTKEVQAALLRNDRNAALRLLRSRKARETVLKQRYTVLNQLESVHQSIEEAATSVDVIAALKAGTASLRYYNQESGGVETVESIIQDVNEEILKAGEIDTIIAENSSSNQVHEDADIDAELAALSAEKKQTEEKQAAEDLARKFEELERIDSGTARHETKQSPDISAESHFHSSSLRTGESATGRVESNATAILQE